MMQGEPTANLTNTSTSKAISGSVIHNIFCVDLATNLWNKFDKGDEILNLEPFIYVDNVTRFINRSFVYIFFKFCGILIFCDRQMHQSILKK